MVNFREPVVIDSQAEVARKLWCVMDGIFIWEFMVTTNYEWSVIRGCRPYRWTIWIYSLSRVATLVLVALNIYSISVTTPINCQLAIGLQFGLAYLALVASSLLIVLRIIAIWNWDKIVVALATSIWVTNIAFLIQGVWRFRSSWDVKKGCVFYLGSIRLSTVVAFAADTILLLIMLLGLYRLRRRGGLMGLGHLLWNQGVLWLLVAVVAELTPTVLILLNLNRTYFSLLSIKNNNVDCFRPCSKLQRYWTSYVYMC